jgi:hypothetical protein
MTESALKKDILDRLFSRFAKSLRHEHERGSKAIALAILVICAFAVALVSTPRIMLSDYVYDFFIPLDGARRALAGQQAHVDFYTPIGDLYYFLLGFCAKIVGPGPRVVMWQQIIVLPVAIVAMLIATRDRLPDSLRALLILMVGLLCVSPSDLDEPGSLSFLASYNRHGWVFIIPILTCSLLEAASVKRWAWLIEAGTLACLVVGLFYLKITFALVGFGTILMAAICVPRNRTSCLAALGSAASAIALIALIRPGFAEYLGDLHRASLAAPFAGENFDPFRLMKLKDDLTTEWFKLLVPVCFAAWLGRTAETVAERQSASRVLLLCMIATAGSVALGWQNHEHSMPSQIVAMAIAFAAMRRRQLARDRAAKPEETAQANWSPVILAGCVFAFIAGVSILDSGRAVILHTVKTALNLGQPVATLSPNLAGLIVPRDTMAGVAGDVLVGKIDPALYEQKSKTSWHNDVAIIMDNGWQLFQAHTPHAARIATLYSAPLMTPLTGTTPPRHMAAWMDVERTVGPRSPLVPERDLVDTNVVMVFKLYNHDLLFDMIKDYLAANFHIAGETPIWQMWVRNGEQ